MATTTKPNRTSGKIDADDPRVARAIFTLRETAGYLGIPKSTVQCGRGHRTGRSL
jgi:hypothetical protein